MPNPFQHMLPFVVGIFSHLFTLLAGCVVTVVVGIIDTSTLSVCIYSNGNMFGMQDCATRLGILAEKLHQ
jgi:hypothetical protein